MKSIITMLMCLFVASSAMALLSQPFADVATSQQGEIGVSGGITIESDVNLYGVRASYGIMDGVSAFAGLGLADIGEGDSEMYFQAGGKYLLPVDLPVDLAIRAGVGFASTDYVDLMTLSGGVLASKVIADGITVYGFAGLSYWKSDYEHTYSWYGYTETVSGSDTETELALAGGAMYAINESISIYGELAMIDEMFISAGVSIKLGGLR